MLLQSVSARRAPSAPTFRMRAAAAFIQGRAGHVEHYASPFLPGVALWFDACRMERPRGQGGAGRKTKEGHCHGHCLADAGQDRYRHGTQNYLPTPAWSDEAAQAAHQPCRSTTVTRRAPDRSTRSAPRRPGLLLASGACRSINHGRGHASPRAHKIKEGSCRKKKRRREGHLPWRRGCCVRAQGSPSRAGPRAPSSQAHANIAAARFMSVRLFETGARF